MQFLPLRMKAQEKTWVATRHRGIYRHKSGIYYLRISSGRKKSWKSLGTNLISVARPKAEQVLRELQQIEELAPSGAISGDTTMGELVALRLKEVENDPSLKPTTRHYWKQVFTALLRSWPDLEGARAKAITKTECENWADHYSKSVSGTRFNNTLSGLKKLFSIAVENGARLTNPASHLKRVRPSQKDLNARLPSREQFLELVATIRTGGGRFSKDAAAFVELLAYSGLRTGEAKWLRWKDCDLDGGVIIVRGDPTLGTKNGRIRRVPIISALQEFLTRQRVLAPKASPSDFVCAVNEAQKSIDHAVAKLGIPRITHHDLRHLFATTCIESGVDIPTVSKWLGHTDGGVLAMKVYGHLRNEHSLTAAKLVSFSPADER